ncbi:MAG: tetratricopeptide repeat protein [Luteolibacter sp.]
MDAGDAQLYVQRADLRRQHEEWIGALDDYETAHKLDSSLELDLLRGCVLLQSGRAMDALPLFNGFLTRHPAHPLALLYRARALEKLDRHSEAATDYIEVLRYTTIPEPDLIMEAGNSFAAHGHAGDAIQILDAGIEKLGSIPSLVLRAIDIEIAAGNFDAALTRVAMMQQGSSRPEPWIARRASILAQAGRVTESRKTWQALAMHLGALPAAERGSHAMSKLMEQTRQALAALDGLPVDFKTSSKP